MTEGNRHFMENWRWEDDLAQSVQQLAAACEKEIRCNAMSSRSS